MRNGMRICVDGLIYRQSPNGGIARYWTELFMAVDLPGAGVRFDVALPSGARRPPNVRSARASSLGAYWAAWRADLFHSTYYTLWPRMRCPSVVTVYDFIDALLPQLRPHNARFVQRQLELIRRAAAVVVISETTRKLAVDLAGADPEKVFLAYPGVSRPFTPPPPAAADVVRFRQAQTGGAPYLLHVGERKNYKNFRTILKAFCRVADKTDRHLIVLGGSSPPEGDEIDWMVSARLLNRIHFLPIVNDDVLRLAYAGADAMVHASLMEGFGIPVVEALASGTGLILSDIPVYREIAGSMAAFVDPVDPDAWGEAILRPVTVQSGWRDAVLSRFSWAAAAAAHLDAYRCALGGSQAHPHASFRRQKT